ncbi:MAG TPA: hypothetical protein PKA31_01210 [Candidatus Moranbacteria bacterium]|nr:hypothetical protein [Candidatus Moranbacteria bacterium]
MLGIILGAYLWGLGICAGLMLYAALGHSSPKTRWVVFTAVIFVLYLLCGLDLILSSYLDQLISLDESVLNKAFVPFMVLTLLGTYQAIKILQKISRERN